MSKKEKREKAFELYKQRFSIKEIAEKLNEKTQNLYSWKRRDEWDKKIKGGAPLGNKNAIGNKGGAPEGNLNGLKHGNYCSADKFLDKGFLRKYIPTVTRNIIQGLVEEGVSALDMLWDNIMLCYTAIIRSQKIMYVKSQGDITKEVRKQKTRSKTRDTEKTSTEENEEEIEYEIQFAWDKQERFIKAQASAMKTLNSLIKDYEDMLHKNWDLATEEQKLRIKMLKSKINDDESIIEDDGFIDALEGKVDEVWED